MFTNLIDNAVKYLRPEVPGLIEISARETPGYITYMIRDNGRGIDPNDARGCSSCSGARVRRTGRGKASGSPMCGPSSGALGEASRWTRNWGKAPSSR